MKIRNLLFLALSVVTVCISKPALAASCIQLSGDLSYGQTDASVKTLQGYLQSLGYLSATPNGYFGNATKAAIKTFQSKNSISTTGTVGPMTRQAIYNATCMNTSIPTPLPTPSPTIPVFSNATPNIGITSPLIGQILNISSSTMIRWNANPSQFFNILLEQPGEVGAGFVSSSLSPQSSSNQYLWDVGKVYSSQSNSTITVSAGTYRLRLIGTNSVSTNSDPVSGWFTIVAPQFSVSSVYPNIVSADNKMPAVLFGSQFSISTAIYFDTNYSNVRANNKYISPDGSVLVFTIPTEVPAGNHNLIINNNNTTVSLPFTVRSIQ